MNILKTLCCGWVIGACCADARAAAPDVKSIFPLGGAIGTTFDVALTGNLPQPGTQVWADRLGLSFEVVENGKSLKVSVAKDAAPGLHWLRFHNAEGASGLVPFVVGTLPEVTEVEPNNTLAKAQTIAASSVINGKLGESGDVDAFSMPLKAGQQLVAAIDSNWRLASPVDIVVQVLGPDGFVFEQNDDDHGNDPFVAFTVPRDGNWTVRIFGFPTTPDSSFRFIGGANMAYRLTLTTGPFANHAMPSVVPAEGGKVALSGWNLPTDMQPVSVGLHGVPWLGNEAIGNTVRVDSFKGVIAVEQAEQAAVLQELTPGSVICGVISKPREEDLFRFKGTKGQKLEFDVDSRSLGYPLDPAIRIYNAEKKVVVESDDAPGKEADPLLKFSVPADGEYSIGIRDIFGQGSPRHAYRLACRVTTPSCNLSTKADALVVEIDKPLEIPVTLTRTDGFAEEVSVSIEGLPKSVMAEPVVSAAKGETAAAVKLVLKNDGAEAWSGPVRILGNHPKSEGQPLIASFANATYKTETRQIWLTVLKKPEPKPEAKPAEEKKPEEKK